MLLDIRKNLINKRMLGQLKLNHADGYFEVPGVTCRSIDCDNHENITETDVDNANTVEVISDRAVGSREPQENALSETGKFIWSILTWNMFIGWGI